jgi:hypothetical protein
LLTIFAPALVIDLFSSMGLVSGNFILNLFYLSLMFQISCYFIFCSRYRKDSGEYFFYLGVEHKKIPWTVPSMVAISENGPSVISRLDGRLDAKQYDTFLERDQPLLLQVSVLGHLAMISIPFIALKLSKTELETSTFCSSSLGRFRARDFMPCHKLFRHPQPPLVWTSPSSVGNLVYLET